MVLAWKIIKILISITEGLDGHERFITASDGWDPLGQWQEAGKKLPLESSCRRAHPGTGGSSTVIKGTDSQRQHEWWSPGPGTWNVTSTQKEGNTSAEERRQDHNRKILKTDCPAVHSQDPVSSLNKNKIKPYKKPSTNPVSLSACRSILPIASSFPAGGDVVSSPKPVWLLSLGHSWCSVTFYSHRRCWFPSNFMV